MEIREQAERLLRGVKKFILCAVDSDGYPTAKAVLPSKRRESLDKMFFVTNTHSDYVKNIIRDKKASVYFFNPILFKGCLLKGEMMVCNDLSIKAKLWKNSYKSAYPNSEQTYNDPDFCVLEFRAIHGRYYSMFKTADFDI
ncbi:hypothetical protein OBV_44620 [Oscillibacter valericigenes Sjm18-20]|nr:hypothetical protein OBV_44620 [Oscillibacter valericigenes Sjm18-20]